MRKYSAATLVKVAIWALIVLSLVGLVQEVRADTPAAWRRPWRSAPRSGSRTGARIHRQRKTGHLLRDDPFV